jgi:hypothetical protein
VGSFGFVELQRTRDAFEHVVGHAGGVAALKPRVVLDTDASEHRRLLTPEPLDAPRGAVGRQARLLGRDPGAP